MNAPPTRQRPPREPLHGTAWFAARLTLALRRTRRFTRWWLGVGGALTIVALLLPVAAGDSEAANRLVLERAAADTLRTYAQRTRAAEDAALADSALAATRTSARRPLSAAPPPDPRLISLDRALRAARESRTREAFLALADDSAVRFGPRMQATIDSLRGAADSDDVARLGGTVVAIAQFRRNAIASQVAESAPEPVPEFVDTLAAATRAVALRDSAARAEVVHAEALRAYESVAASVTAGRAPVPPVSPGIALLALVAAGLALRVGLAVLREMRAPRIASPLEAERAVGASVLALVRDALPDGPLRFHPSGVDPFRVLYLGLTATGTRTRALIVTGDDALIVAAVGARLAIAAAADHRATLIVELDPEQITMARIFRDHAEPGFTDALAGAFKWREISRPVGSSDGLALTMVPAGTSRDPVPDETRAVTMEEFRKFREGFEFTIVTATLGDLEQARAVLPGAPQVLCASLGVTPLARFVDTAEQVEVRGDRIHSLALWDAPRPSLPSRAELAAHLSKRKGRTPGGSFKAVQEATKKPA